jgi:hypothetical protein
VQAGKTNALLRCSAGGGYVHIPSLLLSALSAALQRRARKLAVYSLMSAALPFSLSQSVRLDLLHYALPTTKLRFAL